MFRRTFLAAITALAVGGSALVTTATPASAHASFGLYFGFGAPYYSYGYPYYRPYYYHPYRHYGNYYGHRRHHRNYAHYPRHRYYGHGY